METTDRPTVETASEKPPRRVGTFTLGVTLLASGALMLVSMFFPRFDLSWVLKCSPLILIFLGVETLIAAKGGGKVKYDWVGMLLCFILTGAALCMYAAAWYMSYWQENGHYFDGSRTGNESSLILDHTAFNGTEFQLLELGRATPFRLTSSASAAASRSSRMRTGRRFLKVKILPPAPIPLRSRRMAAMSCGSADTGRKAALIFNGGPRFPIKQRQPQAENNFRLGL